MKTDQAAVMTSCDSPSVYSSLLERAVRIAAIHHGSQTRKGSATPYLTHPVAVALILQRSGFDEDDLIAAALLHDVVEDTACTLDDLAGWFPPAVVETVAALSERKRDAVGVPRPWRDRKQESIEHIRSAPFSARVVALADKLHNLLSIDHDLAAGEDVWSRFNAPRADVLGYYESVIDAACQDDPRLERLANSCREALERLR